MINGSEPAMPLLAQHYKEITNKTSGLTIRQQFAMAAMQGLCASGFYTDRKLQAQAKSFDAEIEDCIAIASIEIANALISQLNKPQP